MEREAAEAHFRRLIPDSRLLEETRVASSGQIANDAQSDLEALRWLSIRRSEDPAVFENFLDAFPEGKFAGLAREHIAELADLLTNAGGSTDEEMAFAPASGEGPLDTDVAAEPALQEASLDIEALSAMETELGLDRGGRIAVQQLLAVMGNYTGALDGAIGPMSRAAIAAFQVDAGLAGTGYLDIDSLARLVEAAAKPALAEEADPNRRGAIHGLAAVARFGPGAAPTTIRVASIARHPEVEAVWRAVADRFEADNPGYPVVFDSRPGAEYKAQLLGMLGSETPPDILFTWGGGHLRAIAHAGFATDLTEAMAAGWAFDYKPGALNNLIIDERIYAAPSNMSLVNLWANRTLLDKAGIEPELLKTWEGLLDAVTRLKAAGVMPIGVGGADRWPLAGYWAGLALAIAGPDGLDAALNGDAEGFEAPAFVEAGARLKDLADMEPFQANYRDLSNIDAVRAFIGGWTAMNLTGDWAYVEMSRNWPGGPDAPRRTSCAFHSRRPISARAAKVRPSEGTTGGCCARARRSLPSNSSSISEPRNPTELARLGHLVPSIAGADDAIGSPTLSAVATELILSRHHQLFLDQVLGPQAGEKLNDVAVAIVDGDLTPEDAAAEIERAWEDARPTLTIDAAEGAATSETVE